jgi:hypothetical protein
VDRIERKWRVAKLRAKAKLMAEMQAQAIAVVACLADE